MNIYNSYNRWKIAIKTTRVVSNQDTGKSQSGGDSGYSRGGFNQCEEISSLMDEAKTMWKVGSYHENIVNLQGITVNVELDEISHVSNSFHVNYPVC